MRLAPALLYCTYLRNIWSLTEDIIIVVLLYT